MKLIRKNIELGPPLRLSSWRKVAIGTWRTAGDPSVYATMELNVEPALRYIEKLRQETGQKITLTHFIGKAIAIVFEQHPEINCILRFGRLYPRKNVDLFFQVANDESGKDLSGTVIRNVNQKSIPEIAQEMQNRIEAIRKKGDPEFKKMKSTMGRLPGACLYFILNIASFVMYTLNLWSPLFGSPRDPFGSGMITNIGSLGLEMAFAPLVPYSKVPFLLAVGAVKEVPIVRDGKIEISKVSTLCATFDHRLIDGIHGSYMAKTMQRICSNPEQELGKRS